MKNAGLRRAASVMIMYHAATPTSTGRAASTSRKPVVKRINQTNIGSRDQRIPGAR